MLKNIIVLKRNKRVSNKKTFDIRYFDLSKTKIVNDNNVIIVKNILMQFQFVKKIEMKKKVKKIIFKITTNEIIKTLKTLHLYEKQQKNDNIDFIRSLKLHKKKLNYESDIIQNKRR